MTNKDFELMEIDELEKLTKAYQSMYYAVNAKPDCKSKAFTKNVIIELSDVYDLNRRIVDKFKTHYTDAGFKITVTIHFKNRKTISLDSWNTFENYKWTEIEAINAITIKWDYNAQLPQYQLPQRHSLLVKMSDGIRPEEMINLVISGKLEEVEELDRDICPIVARVDFIDAILADELLYIVSQWAEGLRDITAEENRLIKSLKKNKRKICYIINYVTLFITLFCGITYLKNYISSIGVATLGEIPISCIEPMLNIIFAIIVSGFVAYSIFYVLANIIFRALAEEVDTHIFAITKGDKQQNELLKRRKNKNVIKIIINGILALIYNIGCGILTNVLSK